MNEWGVVAVVIASVVGPLLLSALNGRQQRGLKQQDWDRQDAVAFAAAQRDEELKVRQEEVAAKAEEAARLLLASNKEALEANQQIGGQLRVIHGLVNSSLTAAIQDTYDQSSLLLLALKAIDKANPTPEGKEAMVQAEAKMTALATTIADRNAAAALMASDAADAQPESNPAA